VGFGVVLPPFLIEFGISRDLGEQPIVDGDLAEEIFLISHRASYPVARIQRRPT
jgi:hypothetical protein